MRSMHCRSGKIFPWWFTFDRQMRAVFARAGAVAELRVVAAAIVALREAARRANHKPRPRTYGSVRGAYIADFVGATLHDAQNIGLRLWARHRPRIPQQVGEGALQGSVGRDELPRPLLPNDRQDGPLRWRLANRLDAVGLRSLYLMVSPSDILRINPLVHPILSQIACRLTETLPAEGVALRRRLLLMLHDFLAPRRSPRRAGDFRIATTRVRAATGSSRSTGEGVVGIGERRRGTPEPALSNEVPQLKSAPHARELHEHSQAPPLRHPCNENETSARRKRRHDQRRYNFANVPPGAQKNTTRSSTRAALKNGSSRSPSFPYAEVLSSSNRDRVRHDRAVVELRLETDEQPPEARHMRSDCWAAGASLREAYQYQRHQATRSLCFKREMSWLA